MTPAGRILALCGLSAALSGCVAAAIPVVAMGAITKGQLDGSGTKARQGQAIVGGEAVPVFASEGRMGATLAPGQVASVQRAALVTPPPAPLPAPEPAPAQPTAKRQLAATARLPGPVAKPAAKPAPVAKPAPTTTAKLVPLTALPAPDGAASSAPGPAPALIPPPPPKSFLPGAPASASDPSTGYLKLVSYAISRVDAPDATSVGAAIDPTAPLAAPRRAQCGALPPAVLIDLDPGVKAFDPSHSDAAPGLAEALAAMRASGLTVLWASALQVEQSEKVRDALARTGLDPARTDRLVLLNGPGDRKQARRESIARNWCVVAMAGDRRGDFDESYDYLRDPAATLPADALFGSGWFMAPAPLP